MGFPLTTATAIRASFLAPHAILFRNPLDARGFWMTDSMTSVLYCFSFSTFNAFKFCLKALGPFVLLFCSVSPPGQTATSFSMTRMLSPVKHSLWRSLFVHSAPAFSFPPFLEERGRLTFPTWCDDRMDGSPPVSENKATCISPYPFRVQSNFPLLMT